jgi:hypothetical protein
VNSRLLSLVLLLLTGLVACADPYDRPIPGDYFTESEAASLAQKLSAEDGEAFQRWAIRMRTSERFPGETTPVTVRGAILSQTQYEIYSNQKRALAAKADEEIKRRQEIYNLQEEIEDRIAYTSLELSKIVVVTLVQYDQEPIYAVNGRQIGWKWLFYFKVENRSRQDVTAIKGVFELSDSFGRNRQQLTGEINRTVPSRKSITTSLTYPVNDASDLHSIMRRGGSVRYTWSTRAVAFGGNVVDHRNIDAFLEERVVRQYNIMVKELERKYPPVNPASAKYSEDEVDRLQTIVANYEKQGVSSVDALRQAANDVADISLSIPPAD